MAITAKPLPEGKTGKLYSAEITAHGGVPPYTWEIYSGAVGGLSLDAHTGELGGIPDSAASVEILVQVIDLFGVAAQQTVTVPIRGEEPLEFVSLDLPVAVSGKPYLTGLKAKGGSGPYRWLVKLGSLPKGLSLGVSGNLQGTPHEYGVFTFIAEASDALGARKLRAFKLTVAAEGALQVSPSEGAASSQVFTVSYNRPETELVLFLLNSSLSGSDACWVFYYRPTDTFWLMNDAENKWLGPAMPGVAPSNSQCGLKGPYAQTRNGSLMLTLPLHFTPSFADRKSLWLYTEETGWQLHGSWMVPTAEQ